MGALFGALAALSIGLADLFSRQIVNRRGPNVAAMMIQSVATLASLGMVLVIASEFGWRDVAIGALSGVGLAMGLACYLGGPGPVVVGRDRTDRGDAQFADRRRIGPLRWWRVQDRPDSTAKRCHGRSMPFNV